MASSPKDSADQSNLSANMDSSASSLFRRMISEEFSKTESEWEIRRSRSRKQRPPSAKDESDGAQLAAPASEEESETSSSVSGCESDEFFSAEEVLLSSDERDDAEVYTGDDDVSALAQTSFPLPNREHQSRSRRQKKKRRQHLRQQLAEALQDIMPVDDSEVAVAATHHTDTSASSHLSIDVSSDAAVAVFDASPMSARLEVPSLVELCLRKIWKKSSKTTATPASCWRRDVSLPRELPYQMRMQGARIVEERTRRKLRMRWALAALDCSQTYYKRQPNTLDLDVKLSSHDSVKPLRITPNMQKERKKLDKVDPFLKYDPGWFRFGFTSADSCWGKDFPESIPTDDTDYQLMEEGGGTVMKRKRNEGGWFVSGLAWLIDLYLPENVPLEHLVRVDGKLLPVVQRIRLFLSDRFPGMCHVGFGVALAYVWWSRGLVDAAVSAFLRLSKQAKEAGMKSFHLNEIGRLYWHLQDCATAGRFFRLAAECFPPSSNTMHAEGTALVLVATMCDCGLFSKSSGRVAHRAWLAALSCLHHAQNERGASASVSMPTPVFVNAVESMLFCHAGKAFDGDPLSREGSARYWLQSAVAWIRPLVFRHPWLSFHLSVLLVLLRDVVQSDTAFSDFLALTWFNHTISPRPPSAVMTAGGMSAWDHLLPIVSGAVESTGDVPLLQLSWRTMLNYPCLLGSQEKREQVADLQTDPFTICQYDENHITANVLMDLPSMQPILNMADGSICHQHSPNPGLAWKVDSFGTGEDLAPSHVRVALLEGGDGPCVILHHGVAGDQRQSSVLELTGVEGCRHEAVFLQLSRVVRHASYKLARQVIDEELQGEKAAKARKDLDRVMAKGGIIPSEDTLVSGLQAYSYENSQFLLMQISTFGEGSICLHFKRSCSTLSDPGLSKSHKSALVIVDARSKERFLSPQIYIRLPLGPSSHCTISFPRNPSIGTIQRFPQSRFLLLFLRSLSRQEDSFTAVVSESGNLKMLPRLGNWSKFMMPSVTLYGHHAVWIEHSDQWRRVHCFNLVKWDLRSMEACPPALNLGNARGLQTYLRSVAQIGDVVLMHTILGLFLINTIAMEDVKEVTDGDAALAMMMADHLTRNSGEEVAPPVSDVDLATDLAVAAAATEDDAEEPPLRFSMPVIPGELQRVELLCQSPKCSVTEEDGTLVGWKQDVVLGVDWRVVWLRIYCGMNGTRAFQQLFSTQLSGFPVEACLLPSSKGLLVASTKFLTAGSDRLCFCREELYWFSSEGVLRGFLPFLGAGPHGFYPVRKSPTRTRVSSSDEDKKQLDGLFVYFSDGHGAVACIQLE